MSIYIYIYIYRIIYTYNSQNQKGNQKKNNNKKRLTAAPPLPTPPVQFPAGTHHLVSVSLLWQCSIPCLKHSFLLFLLLSVMAHVQTPQEGFSELPGWVPTVPLSTSHKSKLSVCKTISSSGFRVGPLPSHL